MIYIIFLHAGAGQCGGYSGDGDVDESIESLDIAGVIVGLDCQ